MRSIRTALSVVAFVLAGVALAQETRGGPGPGYGPGGMMGYGPGSDGRVWPGLHGGPGMMGHGGGPGMMSFGWGMQNALGLSDEQRKKLDSIHDDLQGNNWEIMGKMRGEMAKLRELLGAETLDKAALDATYKRLSDLRQQRFDAQIAAHDQMAALLTKEQRQQAKRFGPWWMDQAD